MCDVCVMLKHGTCNCLCTIQFAAPFISFCTFAGNHGFPSWLLHCVTMTKLVSSRVTPSHDTVSSMLDSGNHTHRHSAVTLSCGLQIHSSLYMWIFNNLINNLISCSLSINESCYMLLYLLPCPFLQTFVNY